MNFSVLKFYMGDHPNSSSTTPKEIMGLVLNIFCFYHIIPKSVKRVNYG